MSEVEQEQVEQERPAEEQKAGGRRVVALAAGGTGGHLFPAQALAEVLVRRGHACVLFSDERAAKYIRDMAGVELVISPAATITPRKPWKVPGQLLRIVRGVLTARREMRRRGVAAAVGFGGYPSLPPLLAAWREKVPLMTHDAGVAIGKANRLLAPLAARMFTSFARVTGLKPKHLGKTVHVGNPVRAAVLEVAGAPYAPPERADAPFRLLITGGSQGAHFFAEAIPAALASLPKALLRRLEVVMQCREEDMEQVRSALQPLGLAALELAPFLADLPRRMAWAHLVIARAGASTIAELMVIGRPAILVPYPHLADDEQGQNAEAFAHGGAGWVMRQHEATAERLGGLLTELAHAPELLRAAHEAALAQGRPDAAERMADVVEQVMAEAAQAGEGTANGGNPGETT